MVSHFEQSKPFSSKMYQIMDFCSLLCIQKKTLLLAAQFGLSPSHEIMHHRQYQLSQCFMLNVPFRLFLYSWFPIAVARCSRVIFTTTNIHIAFFFGSCVLWLARYVYDFTTTQARQITISFLSLPLPISRSVTSIQASTSQEISIAQFADYFLLRISCRLWQTLFLYVYRFVVSTSTNFVREKFITIWFVLCSMLI